MATANGLWGPTMDQEEAENIAYGSIGMSSFRPQGTCG